ncbi:MAG TPA: gamma-glutamyltransferase, partial [Hyphomicrobium sp.]|nr:gamma-glutamyltransferase [Hyphomicrobium sp.]
SGTAAKALVTAKRHMIVAAEPQAAEVGREILRKGGSAVDAAIATEMVLGLVEPQSSGLGGGAFITFWDAFDHDIRRQRNCAGSRKAGPLSDQRWTADGV